MNPTAMWNERFAEPELAYGDQPNDFLAEVAPRLRPASRVLCLAEGQGRNAVFLAGLGHEVTAMDLSPVGLEGAQRLAAARGVSIQVEVGDLAEYELGAARWDAIVAIWCHLPQPVRLRAHRAVVQALAPGGWFILEAYTPDQLRYGTGGPPTDQLLYTAAQLRTDLDGLELVIAQERVREIHEGRYHNGTSAVVQVLARRP